MRRAISWVISGKFRVKTAAEHEPAEYRFLSELLLPFRGVGRSWPIGWLVPSVLRFFALTTRAHGYKSGQFARLDALAGLAHPAQPAVKRP